MIDPSLLLQLAQTISLITVLVLLIIQLRQTTRTRQKGPFVDYEVLEDALVYAGTYILQFTPPDQLNDFETEIKIFLNERKPGEAKK